MMFCKSRLRSCFWLALRWEASWIICECNLVSFMIFSLASSKCRQRSWVSNSFFSLTWRLSCFLTYWAMKSRANLLRVSRTATIYCMCWNSRSYLSWISWSFTCCWMAWLLLNLPCFSLVSIFWFKFWILTRKSYLCWSIFLYFSSWFVTCCTLLSFSAYICWVFASICYSLT